MRLSTHYRGDKVDIRVVPNRGRDIGPLLTEFADEVRARYDVIGHIHTKRSELLAEERLGREWRVFLLEHLLGGKHPMADQILRKMLESPSLGIVFPDDPNVMEWGENLAVATVLAEKVGIRHLPRFHNFPIGTMFWAKVKFLGPLFDLGLTWEDYPEEPLPYDGTLLHALERLVPVAVEHAGGGIALSHVPGVTR
jgi:lipopolysaccharide biosynthesis protein